MKFNIGDKVLFKREKKRGLIVDIKSLYKVVVKNDDGFEENISVDDIILLEPLNDKAAAYGTQLDKKDLILEKDSPVNPNHLKRITKIDLHIELIADDYHNMSNSEIVRMQLSICRERIETVLNSKEKKLLVVHGIGSGVLMKAVHDLLDEYSLRYYLARDGGATEVYF